jgi:hypothetical protein
MKEKGKSGKQVDEAMKKKQREAGARSRKGDRSGEAEESSGPRTTDLVRQPLYYDWGRLFFEALLCACAAQRTGAAANVRT